MAVGILECVLVGWLFDLLIIKRHINSISSIKIGKGWETLIRAFIPIVLGLILIIDLISEFSSPYEGYSWNSIIFIGVGWVLVTLLAAIAFARKPWKEGQLDSASLSDGEGEDKD